MGEGNKRGKPSQFECTQSIVVHIGQIVGVSEVCDKNGHKVFKNDKICHICGVRIKRTYGKIKNMGLCL